MVLPCGIMHTVWVAGYHPVEPLSGQEMGAETSFAEG
jgi:hypothetical protein